MVTINKYIRVIQRIRASQVRLIDAQGKQVGVVPTAKALDIANTSSLDLVEIAPNVNPPVCKIMDFSKFKYEEERKQRQSKKHQHAVKVKEIRLKPHIEEHDYQVKLKHLIDFLKRKDKVKVTLMYRGREMAHREIGQKILDRFVVDIQKHGQIERAPKFEGRSISMVISPK